MVHLFLGFKTFNRNEVPTVLHVGDNVDAGQKAAIAKATEAGSGIVRVGLLKNFTVFPVHLPETESAKAARLTAQAEAEEARRKQEIQKHAELAAKAKKELAEAEAAMEALKANPNDPTLQQKAAKEKAEADAAVKAAKGKR